MQSAPLPANETQRLATLYSLNILDTPREERFDRITRLASRLFDVPIVLVSLIDANRQWFKSCKGLETNETSREISFCAHAILDKSIFIIPDALQDPRFADNPVVTGAPHVRFYAGYPLAAADGNLLGTLCIVDSRPRSFGTAEQQSLRDLGTWVEQELNTGTLSEAYLELQRTRTALHESEARHRALVESAPEAIITLDEQQRITSWNTAAEAMFGIPAVKALQQSAINLLDTTDRERFLAAIQACASNDQALPLELKGQGDRGKPFPMELSLASWHTAQGRFVSAIIRDISERREIEDMKSSFVATVSHELRTPLTAMRGALGLICGSMAESMPPSAMTLLRIASSNCERLVRLTNDILDLEKISAGQLLLRNTEIRLASLLADALAANQEYGTQLGVELKLQEPVPVANLQADPDRLMQVLTNLLSNAAKFSPNGGVVELGARLLPTSLRVEVLDSGPGIPVEFEARIFERFAQADTTLTRKAGGTGLGLSISKAIIDKIGGKIGFDRRAEGGSCFYFELPLA